jgi:hypothetical protein
MQRAPRFCRGVRLPIPAASNRREPIMAEFNPEGYGRVLAPLLSIDRCRSLGPGKPNREFRDELDALTVESAFSGKEVTDPDMAQAVLAGLWLLHDFLEASHRISQSISTDTGSFWHGIMHRREPDYPNAAYWFRRVGRHPVFEPLNEAAQALARDTDLDDEAARLLSQKQWDPFYFIDLVEMSAQGESSARDLCEAIQQREWELLFDHCYRAAIA